MIPELTRQAAFITGRILHQGTRMPIVGQVRITAREGMISDKVLPDGTFVISGNLNQLFPRLDSQSYSLSLTIQANSVQFRLGSVQYQRSVTIPLGSNFDPDLSTIPPDPLINLGNIYLPVNSADDPTADPEVYQDNLEVTIRGRVQQAEQPEIPFPTPPTIQVLQAEVPPISTTTDVDGRYQFTNIIVISPAQIRCSASGFQTIERSLFIDFGKVFNQENFRLLSSPGS